MANALSFLADPEYWRSVRQTAPNSLSKLAQGLATGIAGAPVDLANMAMQPFGIGSERPIGGSNHLAELLNADTRSAPYQIGTMLPVSPTDMVYGLPLLAGIFAGKSAKTADLAKLMKAEELRAAGVPDSKIWGETGWTFGFPDKKPRFEIPDNAAVMAEDAPRQLAQNTGRSQSDIFSHDQLYDSYPESANLWTARMPGEYGGAYTGGVMGKSDMISLGMPKKNIDLQEVKGTNLHELQHAIQQREGFARGGSPENAPIPFMDEISAIRTAKNQLNIDPYAIQNKRASGYPIQQSEIDRYKQWEELTAKEDDLLSESQKISPFEAYRRLAGEAEARLTQARMNLTPEQRLAQYPVSQFDVPVENQIVRYGDDVARSVPIFKKYNPPKALGGKFPELKGVERRPNPAVVAVSNDLTIKTLPDGKFQADYSPLYGGGKPFSALGDNPQELMDMAIARVNRSEKAMLQQQKYSSIPNTWKGDAKKVAKNIIDEYGDVSFASSTQSKSKYITLPSGEKIRISDHALPSSYEGADYDFRYGDDVNTLINLIKSGGK